jgi:hypothetical protein
MASRETFTNRVCKRLPLRQHDNHHVTARLMTICQSLSEHDAFEQKMEFFNQLRQNPDFNEVLNGSAAIHFVRFTIEDMTIENLRAVREKSSMSLWKLYQALVLDEDRIQDHEVLVTCKASIAKDIDLQNAILKAANKVISISEYKTLLQQPEFVKAKAILDNPVENAHSLDGATSAKQTNATSPVITKLLTSHSLCKTPPNTDDSDEQLENSESFLHESRSHEESEKRLEF